MDTRYIQSWNIGAPVMVTGATGYLAAWIVKQLLEAGHTVHATVRSLSESNKVVPLRLLAQATPRGRLKLFEADMRISGSFDAPAQGCGVVIHCASLACSPHHADAQQAVVHPAIEGLRNVVGAVQRTPTVMRMVLTSCVSAIYGDNADLHQHPRGSFDELDWNTSSSALHQPHAYAKLMVEREAWQQQAAQDRWQLVVLNPSLMVGPALTRAPRSCGVATLRALGSGRLRAGVPALVSGWVDVRDVAQAHLTAASRADVQGRYLLCAGERSLLQVAQVLRERFGPAYPLPRFELPKPMIKLLGPWVDQAMTRRYVERNVGYPLRLNNLRSRERLGVRYRALEASLEEHFQQMIDEGIVHRLYA